MIYTYVPLSPKKFAHFCGFLVVGLLFCPRLHAAGETGLSTAGAGFAPMDVKKAQDPLVPISKAQRDEFLQQFKGLIAMGINPQSYARWGGQSMADCEAPARGSDAWCQKCQIDMPDAVGVYYFYPNSKGGACTLQQVDVHVKSTEEVLLKDFRPPLQELLGRGSLTQGAGRHWDTGQDIADLFLDVQDGSGEPPYVHFVWSRSPLIWNNPNALIRTNAYARR